MYIKEGQNNQRFALYVELQARGAKLCGDEWNKQHVLSHCWQQEQDE